MAKQLKERESFKKKKKELENLITLIDKSNTIMITYTTNIPSSKLQKIRKQLKETEIKIVKKKMFVKALEGAKKNNVKELINCLKESSAIIFTNKDAFELAGLLAEYKYPIKAKPGQMANDDIVIEEGPTELMPGPAISELSAAGLKTGIVGGKIAIKERKVIVKKGDVITKQAADILGKLDITPFKIGLTPAAVFDSKESKVYHNIVIDREETLNQIKEANTNVLKLAYYIAYPVKEIIGLLLAKASSRANALNIKIQKQEQK